MEVAPKVLVSIRSAPGGQVALVDVADDVGPGQAQQLVVALDVFGKVLEALASAIGAGSLAPVLRLGQLEALDHGAHGAVEDDDAVLQDVGQRLGAGVVTGFMGLIESRSERAGPSLNTALCRDNSARRRGFRRARSLCASSNTTPSQSWVQQLGGEAAGAH
jgi:hypothetical protein